MFTTTSTDALFKAINAATNSDSLMDAIAKELGDKEIPEKNIKALESKLTGAGKKEHIAKGYCDLIRARSVLGDIKKVTETAFTKNSDRTSTKAAAYRAGVVAFLENGTKDFAPVVEAKCPPRNSEQKSEKALAEKKALIEKIISLETDAEVVTILKTVQAKWG